MTENDRAVQRAGPADVWDVSSRVTVVEAHGRAEGFRVVWVVTY